MNIPTQFTLFGNTIKVRIENIDLDGGTYGYWNDVTNEIFLFRQVKIDGQVHNLTRKQIDHTFWHELRHAMQYYSLGETDEQDAQTFASMMTEFMESSRNQTYTQEPQDLFQLTDIVYTPNPTES